MPKIIWTLSIIVMVSLISGCEYHNYDESATKQDIVIELQKIGIRLDCSNEFLKRIDNRLENIERRHR